MRAMVCHKGAKRKGQTAPSYSTVRQVRGLIKYCLAPARASEDKERVVAVVDGLGMGLESDDLLSPEEADFLSQQLVDDVPGGRRLIRQVVIPLSGVGSLEEQVKTGVTLCRRYVQKWAPGCAFLAILHDDHVGEDGRGIHVHLLIRNSDNEGRALDWSRDDLRSQQSMAWAADLGVTPTRGTGTPTPKGQSLPYPKGQKLDALKLGKLNENELAELIRLGQLGVGRRNKAGVVTSVVLDGRRIRLTTARYVAEREQRMANLRRNGAAETGTPAKHGLVVGMATKPTLPATHHTTRRRSRNRPLGVGFESGREPMAELSGGKYIRRGRAIRVAGKGIAKAKSGLTAVDYIGRVM